MNYKKKKFPWPPGQEPQDDPRVQAIAIAARELNEKRERWLHPYATGGVDVARVASGNLPPNVHPTLTPEQQKDLKSRTLTNLYNQRPTWLQLAHEKLDRAVSAAYGWEWRSPNGGLSDEEVLGRLLEENLRRGG